LERLTVLCHNSTIGAASACWHLDPVPITRRPGKSSWRDEQSQSNNYYQAEFIHPVTSFLYNKVQVLLPGSFSGTRWQVEFRIHGCLNRRKMNILRIPNDWEPGIVEFVLSAHYQIEARDTGNQIDSI
jgi:hypothetical protein